jgi:hypothetical protein
MTRRIELYPCTVPSPSPSPTLLPSDEWEYSDISRGSGCGRITSSQQATLDIGLVSSVSSYRTVPTRLVSSWLDLSLLSSLLASLSSSRLSLPLYCFALLNTWCRCARLVRLAWIVLACRLRIPTNRQIDNSTTSTNHQLNPTRPNPTQPNSTQLIDTRRPAREADTHSTQQTHQPINHRDEP